MSQDGQELQGVGQTKLDQRKVNIAEHNEANQRTLEAISNLFSDDPEKVANGLKTIADLEERDAQSSGQPWIPEQRWEWLGRAVEIVDHAKGGEAVNVAIGGTAHGVFEPRTGVVAWSQEKRQEFMDIVKREGFPPSAPTMPPTPGGIAPAGK